MIHSLFCRHCLCQGLRRKRLIIKVHEKLNSCYLISSRTGLNLKKLTEISRDNLYWATACAILLKIGSALLKELWITCPWIALNWATVMSVKRMEVFLWWKIFFCFWLRLHYVSSFLLLFFSYDSSDNFLPKDKTHLFLGMHWNICFLYILRYLKTDVRHNNEQNKKKREGKQNNCNLQYSITWGQVSNQEAGALMGFDCAAEVTMCGGCSWALLGVLKHFLQAHLGCLWIVSFCVWNYVWCFLSGWTEMLRN